ncbi:uncharacterized protein LOC110115250 [Dendrobium catenatum]|uniref:uncharacterized protein LOC110115250 n=1 Tax=Dendrobium catenatum TaxID=906689 RepID=UPI0009F33267|nr:uncharacterized protein LOC110115250 [Dendrobium catenatum]
MLGEKAAESPETLTASFRLRQLPEDIDQSYAASPPQSSAAPSFAAVSVQTDENDDEDDDFEFAFVVRDPDTDSLITADEIFYNGQIRPVYPIFNRELLLDGAEALRQPLLRLMKEERETEISQPASSSSDEFTGISPETYCVWKPKSTEQCRKSVSTGSALRWRIRDLVIRRSHSDGKEKFVFLETDDKKKEKGKKAMEVDIVAANRRHYDRIGQGATARPGSAGRKSFLPYKPGIVGFFASVNGISRVHHPF